MRKLALKDEILLTVQQPARYIGGEVNMVKKDPSAVDVRFAMCFPDVYEIGMSHLGIQILYSMFNSREEKEGSIKNGYRLLQTAVSRSQGSM